MNREKKLLTLLSDDLQALHSSALILEKDLQSLALETDSQDLASLAGVISQINCTGFQPIETMLRGAGISLSPTREVAPPVLKGVLAEAGITVTSGSRRIGIAQALSVMRRAARYMEMYCTSIAESATRLRLRELAEHLQAWAREWIGLELNLNAVAARPRETVSAAREVSAELSAFAVA